MRSDMDHTVLPANYTMPAFTPQPQNITTLWLVLIYRPAEGRMLSRPGWLVTYRNKVPPPGDEPGHVTHPSTNRARRRVTSLIRPTLLPLRHAATRSMITCYERQRTKICFEPPFARLNGNAHGSSMARWKTHRRLPILVMVERFSLALTTATLLSEICRNQRFLKEWVTLSANFT